MCEQPQHKPQHVMLGCPELRLLGWGCFWSDCEREREQRLAASFSFPGAVLKEHRH